MKLIRTAIIVISLLIALTTSGSSAERSDTHAYLCDSSISQLEQRVKTIDSELAQLARSNMRSGVGSIGYESQLHPDPHHTEWVQVELQRPTPIDQIVIVPTIWHDSSSGFSAGGFPREFQILAGLGPTAEGTVIASFSEEDALLPRRAPLVIPCATTASWVRVQASVLSKRSLDEHYNLQLSELLVFDGQDNLALHRAATSSSVGRQENTSRKKDFLTDGFLPYKMDAGHGEKGVSFQSDHEPGAQPSITIDLGTAYPINRIQLHSQDTGQTAPMAIPEGLGVPSRLVVEGANQADFSDAVELVQYHKTSIFDVGPIVMLNFPETQCRYVRLTALKLTNVAGFPLLMGFAEIELIANGQNVARDKPATVSPSLSKRREVALTDGSSTYGRILPLRQWMEQLARRHDLGNERPKVTAELGLRYARQKENLKHMIWLATLLAGGIVITLLSSRLLRMRQIATIRNRFAADLHDELGANIHTIGMLGDLARDAESHDELLELLDRSHVFIERSGAAVRYCTNMLEAQDLCANLVEEMTRSSERLLADMKYDLSFEDEELLQNLKPRKRIDLFLFYKECLNNVLRHASATHVSTQLKVVPKKLTLTLTDNGIGLPNEIPSSLKRRARLLGAKLSTETPANGGTRIVLKLRIHNWKKIT